MITGKLIFRIPGPQGTHWTDNLNDIRSNPQTIIEVRDTSICRNKCGSRGESLGKIQLQAAKLKYAAC